jgi:hypothetical protein
MTRWLAMPAEGPLAAAAFGDDPGCWPLPAARTPLEGWLRAVAAGGQGRYGCAMAELASLRRRVGAGPLASLANSTHASFLRQLGGHAPARRWDGRALALAGRDVESGADALIGLAADALGMQRFAASAALLDRARSLLAGTTADHGRVALRLAWVGAELAMVSGDGAAALRHAERARELADSAPSLRHRVKTDVVLAAALCSAGRPERARTLGREALIGTERLGLVPLRWALACMLIGIGGDTACIDRLRALRDGCAAELQRRGGDWQR